ncbi:hypothetical protein [Flavobacterium sp. W20_MBD1_R3]|uniref:hypothetical protein n=1 Tax=Flavobacterium sp. W20_MBD1_R3 TaxID=3240278 RepID=UPI003F91254F
MALALGLIASAQVKIGTNPEILNSSSILELESTDKGILFPRVALSSTNAFTPLAGHVAGMVVYNTATTNDVTPGLYANNGTTWVKNEPAVAVPLNVTALITGNYTALPTDDIILLTITVENLTLTLPTSGIAVGKKYYVSNNGAAAMDISPLPREGASQLIPADQSLILMYLGGSGAGSWSIVSGY